MSDPSRGARSRVQVLLLLSAASALPSCANPLASDESDYGPRPPIERLRTIGTLSLDPLPAAPAGDATVIPEPPPSPFLGREKVEVSIEQCRAWTLANNLDLQVQLINPTIQIEALSGEEAKFEAVFTTRARYNNLDSATASSLDSGQAEIFDITPGVTLPLRTGGTVNVGLPINRTESDNEFNTLNPSYTTDVQFSIVQPLLRNAGRRAATYPIRIQAINTRIAEAQAKLEVIRQVAAADRAYWRLYAAKRLLEVRQEQYDLAKAQLERAERRVRARVAPEVEIIRAQSGLADRLEGIIQADNNLRLRMRDLKRIVNVRGMEIGTELVLETITPPDPVEFDLKPLDLAEAGVENRMEMLELELRLAQDVSTIAFQRNQALPLFTIDYQYGVNGLGGSFNDAISVARGNRFEDWTLGVNLEIPLGNEAAESRVNQAILTRLQRLATRDLRTLAIKQEVFNSIDGINASWQRILASRQSTILAARTLQAEQNQFDVGARTSTDVLDAATRLADAQQSEIAALTDYQVAQVDLAFATGTLLGASRIAWEPRDPRRPDEMFGDEHGRTPLGPPGPELDRSQMFDDPQVGSEPGRGAEPSESP